MQSDGECMSCRNNSTVGYIGGTFGGVCDEKALLTQFEVPVLCGVMSSDLMKLY